MTVRIDGTNTAANPGITGSDTDTGLTFGTDTVNVVTGGSTRATVDSSGRLGIGTTTPGSYDTAADDLVVSGSGEAGITVVSGTSNGGNIYFADGTTGNEQYRGWITYSHNTDYLRFGTSGTEKLGFEMMAIRQFIQLELTALASRLIHRLPLIPQQSPLQVNTMQPLSIREQFLLR